jgi:hypothetical protein
MGTNANRKTIQISQELHGAYQKRAKREGRQILTLLAIASHHFLGKEFPKTCPEHEMLPENYK